MQGVSIIVCCYNSSRRITKTIEYLGQQYIPNNFKWEIIFVDNNSKDNTVEIIHKIIKKCNNNIDYSVVKEPIQGLSFARKRGIKESKYEYLLFCDDDNWLNLNYMNISHSIMASNDSIGILGGRGIPVYESEPDNEFKNIIEGAYAVGSESRKTGEVDLAYGAGMVVRKQIYERLQTIRWKSFLSGRKGIILSSGEDTELCFAVKLLNYQIWYDDRLYFEHYLESHRLNIRYYYNLRKAFGKSEIIIDIYRCLLNENNTKPFITWYGELLKNVKSLLRTRNVKTYFFSRNLKKKGDLIQKFSKIRALCLTNRRYGLIANKLKVIFEL